ncbi:hypothetical protein JKG47_15310 [Acidithiobacillus sp. MC6.1]|nr:hypothetical protein [Acidithiobacillus sp. MC6.1]
MKAIDKSKAQKAIGKIQSGSFDELDVDGLFMRLRAYSHGHAIFREFADLVAHNDERDRGMTNTHLEALYLSFRYFLDYTSPKVALDISKPFPLYVKKLMAYQADKVDPSALRERFSVTPERLMTKIHTLFSGDNNSGTAVLKRRKIGQHTLAALQYIMGFIITKPVITQDLLLDQLISVLRQNQIDVDETALRDQAPGITLAALLLLHDTSFNFGGHRSGYCRITCEKTSIPYNTRFIDEEGHELEHTEEFGHLQVNGHVVLDKDGRDLTISFPVMSTFLKADEWCNSSIFCIEQPEPEHAPGLLMKVAKLDTNLCLDNNLKLCRT